MGYGDPKVVVDVKDIEHGEILYTDTDGKQRTYYPNRSIWLEVQTLEVLTILGEPKEEGAEPLLMTRVRGTALLEDHSISVVGDPESRVRQLSISLAIGEWPPKPEGSEPGNVPSMFGQLGRAMLGFNRADWEIGNSDEWWIECYLPKPFIEAMVADIRSGQINGMQLSLALRGLYTTEHSMAPPSSRGHLFIRPNKRDNSIEHPELATGDVRAIHFASASRDLRKHEPQEPEAAFTAEPRAPEGTFLAEAEVPEDPVATAVEHLGARFDKMRATVKWVGGLIVGALLILAFR
ncbi:hypothetical protein BL241_03120 [Ralstonia solanacearum]|uniref:Transmembrane protein n=1 Tax=Ralstonia solanacearum TaxID=305 RepID=A0A0S4U290_RALSL|nr:hypothetical protein BL241_03120 [Ralstonia solanacearum]CUV16227.1 protein of unknown function [Ralstonia solanacearum]